ncbi:MAG: molybdate ABC transporter substrate-binding protein [Methanomassiliicoccus sp.]|nr:molybdate ABC transporter substrate-binding protein [Methanomassiliicoccus sp.]
MKNTKMIVAIAAVLVVAMVAVAAVSMNGGKSSAASTEVTVFAAASLSKAFTEIGEQYEAEHSGVKINFNFDGSANLKTQLVNGATADVFASADNKNMNLTQIAGLMDNSTVKTFVKNKVTVIIPSGNPAGITSLTDLTKSGLKIVIGDTTVPIGNYTRTILKNLDNSSSEFTDYEAKVMANVVSQESNVNNVVTKVALGEADAGFVYTTDAAGAGSNVSLISIPDEYNVIAVYPIGALLSTTHSAEAISFIEYVLSTEGQAILSKYGFITVI